MKRCRKCLLPDAVPSSHLDKNGVCEFCRKQKPAARLDNSRYGEDFARTMQNTIGGKDYDVLVCLSGGKDSLMLLHLMKEVYKKRVLAFTTNVNIPEIAWKSIRKATALLKIDHLVYQPDADFYFRLFRYLLKNQEARGAVYTVSYVYAPLFEGDAIACAYEKQIPLIVAGYSPGQPEPERMEYEFSRKLISETSWIPPQIEASSDFTESDKSRFWNPLKVRKQAWDFPRYIAPFHAIDYDQNKIMQKVSELGLVEKKSHASPILSNYPINWLLMYSDLKNFGYNPYAPEFSTLIREGKASLQQWRILAPLVDLMIQYKVGLGAEIKRSLKWLNLSDEDLKINLPQGAYDPIF